MESLKWQRIKPYEKFTAMIERREGIVSYCYPRNKVSLGREGLTKRIRGLQRPAYGYRDEESLKLPWPRLFILDSECGKRPTALRENP